jgi:hypothetical protein
LFEPWLQHLDGEKVKKKRGILLNIWRAGSSPSLSMNLSKRAQLSQSLVVAIDMVERKKRTVDIKGRTGSKNQHRA